jgi:hypothetical protein
MAQDGITYSPDKEDELIGLMAQYMKKAGMSSKQIRYYLSYDEDFIPDQLSDLPRQGVAEGAVKELSSDLKTMSDEEFQSRYKMSKADARANLKKKDEGSYYESLSNKLAEKLNPNAPTDVWVKDFQKADPSKYRQFKNKTPAKKAQMAVAAHYAANEPSKKK